jgi:AAA ATPase domain
MLRIKSFQIHRHPLLGGANFELTNPTEDKVENYYSVIIGPNGTGKSYMLNNLIEAFNEIALLKNNEQYKLRRKFSLDYSLAGYDYFFSTESREVSIKKNGRTTSITEIQLPSVWLASSVTINDKYPILNYIRKKQIPQYKYLGIRSASNNAFISRITINTVLYFLTALRNDKASKLLSIYEALDLKPEVQIRFIGGPMLKLEKKDKLYRLYKSITKLTEPHNTFLKKNKNKINYRADTYKKHLKSEISIADVFSFMSENIETFEKPTKASIQLNYVINLKTESGISKIIRDWNIISIMLDLEIIKISKFLLTKNTTFKYEEASSGESHLLSSLHGIVANLEDNSLIIVDEPEVSLHPNWQIDYIEILKTILKDYKGVNTVISSHSHFIMSSLKNEESRITSIRRNKEDGKLQIEELDFETYGWDPESILYNVFEVATLRNKYFELDLKKLISLITVQSTDIEKIKDLRNKVAKYILANEDDPLNLLIQEVDKYLIN